jgi:hypothetical protein
MKISWAISLLTTANLISSAVARIGDERDLQGYGNGNNGDIEIMAKYKNADGKRAAEQAAASVKGYIPPINVVGLRLPEAAVLALSNNPNIE